MASAIKWKAVPCCEKHTDLTTWPWLSVEGPRTGGAGGQQFTPEDARLIAAAPRMHDVIDRYAKSGDVEAKNILEEINGRS